MSRTEKAATPASASPAASPTAGSAGGNSERIPRPAGGPGRGGPFAGMNIPAEKAMNFIPSAKRLLGELHPERLWLTLVVALAVVSVAFSVIGPRLLGEGTNLIFAGVVSRDLPAGVSKAELLAQLRASGENQRADMLSAMTLTPGTGIDFTALATVLLWALALYVLASAFMWMQAYILNGIVQRTVYRLRERIEAKINRLPLRYFDSVQRGELLSRVTNDVDNVSQSLQQSISQAVTSLLTVLGVLVMMFLLSPTLALIALVTIPLTLVTTALIAKRSQKLFVAQWKHTGELNGQIEETYTGHALVKVFGRQREVEETFRQKNTAAVPGELRRAVRVRADHAGHDVHRESRLCGDRRGGRPAGRYRGDAARRCAGVHPVLAAVHPAAGAAGVHGEPAAVRGGLGGAGL